VAFPSLLQFAKLHGARVIITSSNDWMSKVNGADATINYKKNRT